MKEFLKRHELSSFKTSGQRRIVVSWTPSSDLCMTCLIRIGFVLPWQSDVSLGKICPYVDPRQILSHICQLTDIGTSRPVGTDLAKVCHFGKKLIKVLGKIMRIYLVLVKILNLPTLAMLCHWVNFLGCRRPNIVEII